MRHLMLGALLLWATPGRATVVEPLGLSEMAARAEAVVRGHVVGSETVDVRGRYETRVRLLVDEVWKGSVKVGDTVTVFTLGGTVGPLAQKVAGEARFADGEHVVVMLERLDRRPVVLGMSLGKFRVETQGGEVSLVREPVGLEVAGPGPDAPVRPAAEVVPARVPAETLRAALRGPLGAPGSVGPLGR
jgi:hypothetical protein